MNTQSTKKIFISGIAGSGVSAITGFLADKGNIIVGSDRAFDNNPENSLKKVFLSRGISIVPQDGKGLDRTFDCALFSTAVENDNPELIRAHALGIPVIFRPQMLADMASSFSTIAISGTSGKSSTSGLLAFLMQKLGMNPNFMGGGRVKQFKTGGNPGNSLTGTSDILVIEACESDGSIVHYTPEHSVVLNLSLDHHSIEETAGMFKSLSRNTRGRVFINRDDSNLKNICQEHCISFSLRSPSDYQAEEIMLLPLHSEFTVHGTRFHLSLPGEHNIYNALACIAVLSERGIPLDKISTLLPEFRGIDRRFDVHFIDGSRFVIDDYAHNPHKIEHMMNTVHQLSDKICFIFQPHGFGPTRMMKREYVETFITCLRSKDHLIVLPIYYAGGTISNDISSNDLVHDICKQGKSAESIQIREDVLKMAGEFNSFIIFGARDETLSEFAEKLAGILKQ